MRDAVQARPALRAQAMPHASVVATLRAEGAFFDWRHGEGARQGDEHRPEAALDAPDKRDSDIATRCARCDEFVVDNRTRSASRALPQRAAAARVVSAADGGLRWRRSRCERARARPERNARRWVCAWRLCSMSVRRRRSSKYSEAVSTARTSSPRVLAGRFSTCRHRRRLPGVIRGGSIASSGAAPDGDGECRSTCASREPVGSWRTGQSPSAR